MLNYIQQRREQLPACKCIDRSRAEGGQEEAQLVDDEGEGALSQEGRVCDGSLEPPSQGEGEGTGGEGASPPSDACERRCGEEDSEEGKGMDPLHQQQTGMGHSALSAQSESARVLFDLTELDPVDVGG